MVTPLVNGKMNTNHSIIEKKLISSMFILLKNLCRFSLSCSCICQTCTQVCTATFKSEGPRGRHFILQSLLGLR